MNTPEITLSTLSILNSNFLTYWEWLQSHPRLLEKFKSEGMKGKALLNRVSQAYVDKRAEHNLTTEESKFLDLLISDINATKSLIVLCDSKIGYTQHLEHLGGYGIDFLLTFQFPDGTFVLRDIHSTTNKSREYAQRVDLGTSKGQKQFAESLKNV